MFATKVYFRSKGDCTHNMQPSLVHLFSYAVMYNRTHCIISVIHHQIYTSNIVPNPNPTNQQMRYYIYYIMDSCSCPLKLCSLQIITTL